MSLPELRLFRQILGRKSRLNSACMEGILTGWQETRYVYSEASGGDSNGISGIHVLQNYSFMQLLDSANLSKSAITKEQNTQDGIYRFYTPSTTVHCCPFPKLAYTHSTLGLRLIFPSLKTITWRSHPQRAYILPSGFEYPPLDL